MKEESVYSTQEAAERLNVHVRTVRKWIDAFPDYVSPQKNKRGHYVLNESGLAALQNIQKLLRTNHQTLRQVRAQLIKTGQLPPAEPSVQTKAVEASEEFIKQLAELKSEQKKTLHMLDHIQETLHHIQKKQEQLKFELRHATFEQRLHAAGENGKAKRKKIGALRLSQLFR